MKKSVLAAVLTTLLLTSQAFSQSYSGTYTATQGNVTLTLVIQQDGSGNLSGSLTSSTGAQFQLVGKLEQGGIIGIVKDDQGGLYFQGEWQGNQLQFALIEPDRNNQPNYSTARQLVFTRKGGQQSPPSGQQPYSGPALPGPSSPAPSSGAVNFTGTFVLSGQAATVTLALKQDSSGKVTGTFTSTGGSGSQMSVNGEVQDGKLVGICTNNQAGFYIQAELDGNSLNLSIIQPDANNQPDYSSAKQLTLLRKGAAPVSSPAGKKKPGKARQSAPSSMPASSPAPSAPAPSAPAPSMRGGTEVTNPSWSFKFTAPAGWQAQTSGEGAILQSQSVQGVVLVLAHNFGAQQVQAQMQQGLQEEGVTLTPTSQIQRLGNNAYVGDYQGYFNGQPVKARCVGTYSNNGGGAFVIALGNNQQYTPQLGATADAIGKTVTAVQMGGPAGDSGDMTAYFAGTWSHFTQNHTTSMTLYPNGTFSDYSESYYSGQSGTYAGQNQVSGRWSVRGNKQSGVITFQYSDGRTAQAQYHVHQENGKVYWNEYKIDGQLWSRSK